VPGYSFGSSKTGPLKLNPSLYLDHSPGQAAFSATEEGVLHLCAWAVEVERLQIQDIEDIEEVCLYLEEPAFAAE
jgi:hypothetical protein